MIETAHRDGRARIVDWKPSDSHGTRTPALIVPDTTHFPATDADVALRAEPTGQGIEIISNGTWFHSRDAQAPLLVQAPMPGPTSQVQVLDIGEDVAVWHDAVGWASNPKQAVAALIEARTQATMGRILWAPGIGNPASYALWTYLGIDLFDASVLQLAAIRGDVLTTDGALTIAQAEEILGGTWDAERIWAHNLDCAHEELRRIRAAIRDGTLRALVERRITSNPAAIALLRRFDREHGYVESATPVTGSTEIPCMTVDSLWMPAVERFRRRLRDAYEPPEDADILVLLPCSAKKPYKISQSHRYFARALDDSGVRHRCHEVMITSPLGIVPRELEDVHPANRYDVPVTGHWSRDEEAIIREQVAALVAKHDYKHVVAHVPASTFTFLRDILPDASLHTAHGRPQGIEDCNRLREALRGIRDADKKPSGPDVWRRRKLQDVQALASFQFGPEAAASLVADAQAHGKVPYVKLSGPEGQRAITAGERGFLSLTLHGAACVAPHGVKQVQTGNFPIRKTGSLFAVGVESATPDVRPGDDVIVVLGDTVRAVGVAEMAADEMTDMTRGIAVKMRHIAESAKEVS